MGVMFFSLLRIILQQEPAKRASVSFHQKAKALRFVAYNKDFMN